MTSKHLILGGARSGKSSFAEKTLIDLAKQTKAALVYVATAEPGDDEMTHRIAQHQSVRNTNWRLIEEPLDLAHILNNANAGDCILIDCLTLWLSNCLHCEIETTEGSKTQSTTNIKSWTQRKDEFISALLNCPATVFLVSNEVGQGIVPMGALSRRFVDESGWLHQELAEHCDKVSFIIAGLETKLK